MVVRKNQYRSMPVLVSTGLMVVISVGLTASTYSSADSPAQISDSDSCDAAEVCFQAGALPKERLRNVMVKDQVSSLQLERLRLLMEKFPSTTWAKRGGLLSGVLLIQRNPAVAIQYLRGAQRDFPVLDDYIRLWIGEASLSIGDASMAANMFESIPVAAPDTNLSAKAAYRAGEAWYQSSDCMHAEEWFTKALALNEKDTNAPQALFRRAACRLREDRVAEGREVLRQLWVRYPSSPEAKEAGGLLASNLGGEPWVAAPADRLARAQNFLAQAYHQEAIDEFRHFLSSDPNSPRRSEARLRLGVAQVRLKQYDHARETFSGVVKTGGGEAQEAAVWLARVYLRRGEGEKLLEAARSAQTSALSPEQKGQIVLFAGIWLEDQKLFDDAIARYRQVAKSGEPASQRAEGQWRAGWVYYRMGRYREAVEALRTLVEKYDSDFEPQALYWTARAVEQGRLSTPDEYYREICQRFVYTYYCQLARERTAISFDETSGAISSNGVLAPDGESSQLSLRSQIARDHAYRRALELKTLGLDAEAAREVVVLTDRYGRDPALVMTLSTMLNEVGAYNYALRLARSQFRDKLERTGGTFSTSVWQAAYPTGLLSTIKLQGAKGVDPYLIAAIIREESQYDLKAVSRVGAIGLMQVMPATANTMAQRLGLPAVGREDLFDQDTNIRIGVRYVEQLLDQYSGNLVYTIAAYNAGPPVVTTWINQYRGQSQDEFVELIPYQETRQYVKRVLRSYREYMRLGNTS